MANHWCINGTTLDTKRYSSPIPLIGLYIASATSICFLFMLFDAFKVLIQGKRWLPCGLFSLNSLTLTLLSISTKIPVDLTTSMPSARDQLSKLCGTTMICVSMGVLMPSVGPYSYSESINNIVALTILVITVIVNICIQISTGVIYSFITEHVIILICMLALLVVLCVSTIYVHIDYDTATSDLKDLLEYGEPSLMNRVQKWYSQSSERDRQRLLCSGISCSSVVFFCALCSAVLSQAVIRSMALKKLQFCEGLSDYGWSVWMIVVSQIIIVVVGTLFTIFRFIISPTFMYETFLDVSKHEFEYVFLYWLLARRNVLWILVSILKWFALVTMSFLCKVSAFVPVVLLKPFQKVSYEVGEDLSRLIKGYKKDPLNNLNAILSKHGEQQFLINEETQKTSLLVVMLVRVTDALLPPARSESLNRALDEVFEIISYVDKKINKRSSREIRKQQRLERIWWMGRGISSQLLQKTKSSAESAPEEAANHAISTVMDLFKTMFRTLHFQHEEMDEIIYLFQMQRYTSMEELYDQIEQLFCALVCFFLAQLPKVVFEEIHECPIGEYEEKGRLAIKFLCKMELLKDKIQWLFPEETDITSL